MNPRNWLALPLFTALAVAPACGGDDAGDPDPDIPTQPSDPEETGPTTVQIHFSAVETARLLVHDSSGAFVKEVELAEDGTAEIPDMPAGGMLTAIVFNDDDKVLTTITDVQLGDNVVFGEYQQDIPKMQIDVELPALNPPGTDHRVVRGGCGATGVGAVSSTTFMSARDCLEGGVLTGIMNAFDADDHLIGYSYEMDVGITDNPKLDLSSLPWQNDVGTIEFALTNSPEAAYVSVIVDSFRKGSRLSWESQGDENVPLGASVNTYANLVAGIADRYVVEIYAEDGDYGYQMSWQTSDGSGFAAGDTKNIAMELDTGLMPYVDVAGATTGPVPYIASTLTETPSCAGAGSADFVAWEIEGRVPTNQWSKWVVYNSGDHFSVQYPELPGDLAVLWPYQDFDYEWASVSYVANNLDSYDDLRTTRANNGFMVDEHPVRIGEQQCATQNSATP